MPRGKHVKLSANELDYFWLEIEVLPTDSIVRELNGGRIRHMMYPANTVGMGMEFMAVGNFLKRKTKTGKMMAGVPVGFVRCGKRDMSMLRRYMCLYKGTGRRYATSLQLAGRL
jgi:hypothetical protein